MMQKIKEYEQKKLAGEGENEDTSLEVQGNAAYPATGDKPMSF